MYRCKKCGCVVGKDSNFCQWHPNAVANGYVYSVLVSDVKVGEIDIFEGWKPYKDTILDQLVKVKVLREDIEDDDYEITWQGNSAIVVHKSGLTVAVLIRGFNRKSEGE